MTVKDLICFGCKHFKNIDGCVAFDGEIPEIIIKKNEHKKPIKGQKNDFIFEPIDETQTKK